MERQRVVRIGNDTSVERAFFQAGRKEHITDPLHDPGIMYEMDLVYRTCSDPGYLVVDRLPASVIMHARWIDDIPTDPGVLGDNLLWCYAAGKSWLYNRYRTLGDERRDARWNILASIRTLYLESEEELFRPARRHLAEEIPRYARVMEQAFPLFNDNVSSSLTRIKELRIEAPPYEENPVKKRVDPDMLEFLIETAD